VRRGIEAVAASCTNRAARHSRRWATKPAPIGDHARRAVVENSRGSDGIPQVRLRLAPARTARVGSPQRAHVRRPGGDRGRGHAWFGREFVTPQDWSAADGLRFWYYGRNSGETIAVDTTLARASSRRTAPWPSSGSPAGSTGSSTA
jgi:hypothetical protein